MFMIFPLLVLIMAIPIWIITMICDTNIFNNNNKYKRDNSTIFKSIFMGNGLIGYMREKNIG